jgi:hypothetical protein
MRLRTFIDEEYRLFGMKFKDSLSTFFATVFFSACTEDASKMRKIKSLSKRTRNYGREWLSQSMFTAIIGYYLPLTKMARQSRCLTPWERK